MEKNPIEHQDYLVMRHLAYRICCEPMFAQSVDRMTVDFFEGNEVFQHIYSIAKQEYRAHGYKKAIQRDWLRTELAGKLDSIGADVETRGMYDYVVQDLYVADSEPAERTSMNRKVSEHIRKVSVTNEIKRVVSQDLSDSAIENFIKAIDRVNTDTANRELPSAINVMATDELDKRAQEFRELLVSRQPVPYEAYNIATGGGLSRGEMGAIGASSGSGKTLHLSSLATAYCLEGLNVAYFALEELVPRMVHRFYKGVVDAYIQKSDTEVFDDEKTKLLADLRNAPDIFENGLYKTFLTELREKHGVNFGSLYLIKYLPYEMGLAELDMSMQDLQVNQGVDIGVMIVDYPDLMDYDRSMGESEAGGRLYASIRGIGQKYDAITWVASQLNRMTYGADLKTEAHIEGSYRKQNALECLVVINQTSEEYENGFTRIYVGKARNSTNKGKILQLTVNRRLGVLRNQTPFEANRHASLLDSNEDTRARDGGQRGENMLTKLNQGISGALAQQAKGVDK